MGEKIDRLPGPIFHAVYGEVSNRTLRLTKNRAGNFHETSPAAADLESLTAATGFRPPLHEHRAATISPLIERRSQHSPWQRGHREERRGLGVESDIDGRFFEDLKSCISVASPNEVKLLAAVNCYGAFLLFGNSAPETVDKNRRGEYLSYDKY
jgi:hypothetical protein